MTETVTINKPAPILTGSLTAFLNEVDKLGKGAVPTGFSGIDTSVYDPKVAQQTKLQLEDLLLRLCHQFKHTVVFVTHDLAEAVALSDRVLVMSSRPGKIIADISIDLPRPRSIRELQKSQKFHELYSVLWTYLEEGWVRHEG